MQSSAGTRSNQELLDREAIRDVLYRYAHAVDRCEPELLRAIYWPDAVDDHGAFIGKRDDFIAYAESILTTEIAVSQHFLGNILIRIEGTLAKVETYFWAYHRTEKPGQPPHDMEMMGRYLDRMEKRGDEWRIAHRIVAFDAPRRDQTSTEWAETKFGVPRIRGLHKPHDKTAELFGDSLFTAAARSDSSFL
jgi:hypothetical protein